MENPFLLEATTDDNPVLFGSLANQAARQFSYGSYADFLKNRQNTIPVPHKPNQPICFDPNQEKQAVFTMVWQRLKYEHQNALHHYDQQKAHQTKLNTYSPDLAGYAGYIKDHHADTLPFLFRRHLIPVGENHRRKHTYITGGAGSGKTEAIKSFLWHYLTRNTNTGLILIDPHGTVSEQVARFEPNAESDRLIYIDPAIDYEHFPCLNPFDIDDKETMSDIMAENYAEEFRAVFEELLKGDFTEQMNTILIYTLPVMMKYPNASIYDLLAFLEVDGDRVGDFVEFAQKRFNNRSLLEFLSGQYELDKSYKQTRNSLQTRLRAIFSSTILQAVFTGKKTLNLASAMNEKKLIVFNLAKGKIPREWSIIGKFVIASLKIIALQREKIPEHKRISCHVFVDECQNFITPSIEEILKEARKYMLHLTLAQQVAGDGMTDDFLEAILANTAVKVTGANGQKTLKIMSKETGAELEILGTLSTGKFSLWKRPDVGEKSKPPTIVSMPTNTIGNKESMNHEHWQQLKRTQLETYYRRLNHPIDIKSVDDREHADRDHPAHPEHPLNTDLSKYLN